MRLEPDLAPIRTRRLQLVTLTASLVEAITSGRLGDASAEIGAPVAGWLATDPSHLVQLRLAAEVAAAHGFAGLGRLILIGPALPRRAIGSIGFHGIPDPAGRLEVGCRIHPAHRGRGYGAEATTGLLDWATERFDITRYLIAVPPWREASELVPVEIETRPAAALGNEIGRLADILEGERP